MKEEVDDDVSKSDSQSILVSSSARQPVRSSAIVDLDPMRARGDQLRAARPFITFNLNLNDLLQLLNEISSL